MLAKIGRKKVLENTVNPSKTRKTASSQKNSLKVNNGFTVCADTALGKNSIFAFFPYHVFVCVNSVCSVCIVHGKNQRHLRRNNVNSEKAYLLLHLCRKSNSTLSNMRKFREHYQFLFPFSDRFAIKGWIVYYTT